MSEHEPPRPEAPDQVVTDHIDHRGTSDRDRVISPAVIGEYISFDQCPRYFKHKGQDIDHSWFHEGEDFEEAFQALNLLLSKAGKDFEQAVLEDLSTAETDEHTFARDSDEFESDATALVEILVTACEADPAPTGPSILYQTSLTGQIGVWHVGGDADIILVWATEEGAHIRVLDAKSTREEKPYHQIQAAAYADLINGLITDRADLDRATITIDAGIVSRESEFESPTQDGVPSFDVAPRIMDIRRLLGPDGELTDLAGREFDDVSYQLNEKCARCSFNEACVTDAFEEGHLRLLGLSTAQQETLAAHGVESVADVAELCNPLSEKKWHPEHYPAASFSKPIYDEIKSISGIGELLPTLVYRAQALCDSFDPETDGITDRPQTWIPGTGRCDLPEDNPPDTTGIEHDWLHGSMIRIYVNVQTDHLRDRLIQVSGRVTATASTTEAQRFSILSEAAPTDTEASLRTEKALLAAFIDQLYDAIRAVNAGIDYGESVQTEPPIHVYFYTEHERSALDDAFERHDSDIITSFQSLLEGTAGRKQPMTSALRSVVENHIVLETPSSGLVHAYDELSSSGDAYAKSRTEASWSYKPSDDAEPVNLRRVFGHRLFDTGVACERNGDDGISVTPTESDQREGLNTRMRYGAEIPLGYLWAAVGRIDEEWLATVADEHDLTTFGIDQYRYQQGSQKDQEIQRRDVEALGRHLCDAMEHIERALDVRDPQVPKEPYPLDKLGTDQFQPPSLATAAQQYLWIEHTARRNEEYEHYRKHPDQRMLAGKTLPVHITDLEQKNNRTLRVEGQLRFDEPFGENPESVRRACRMKGSGGASSGSWMVANEYDFGRPDAVVTKPSDIERGVQATIESLDLDSCEIVFEVTNYYGDSDLYGREHDTWVRDEQYVSDDSTTLYFASNETVILDPQTDDITASRAKTALDHATSNALHERLEQLRFGEETRPTTSIWNRTKLNEFADWIEGAVDPPSLPSEEQRAFITAHAPQFVGLQGPPGTGKTAGAMAPAICARAYSAAAEGDDLAILVTAPSNTAIDELLSAVAERIAESQDSSGLDTSMHDVHLVRIADDEPADAPENVEYVDYNDEEDDAAIDRIGAQIIGSTTSTDAREEDARQQTLSAYEASQENNTGTQVIVFATPARAWRFVERISDSETPEETAQCEYWDCLAVDEASMMTSPLLLLAGSAFKPTGQVLIGGDHRQLPPVQTHAWEDESRRDIRSAVPYLSALDYLRLLRGEAVLSEEQVNDWVSDRDSTAVELPLIRLSQTYRFGSITASIVQQAIYSKDDITYTSDEEPETVDVAVDSLSDFASAVLHDSDPIALITYAGANDYQQWNPLEEVIATQLIGVLHPDTSAGVVTPHNAQRSRIASQLSESLDDSDGGSDEERDVMVDTVNRFQGGEADLMIVSATVSDPQYISAESDFLLSENRINVSLTRHRDKLVVIVPESLLGFIPADKDLYDDARIWKLLSRVSGEAPPQDTERFVWNGTLADIVSSNILEEDDLLNTERQTVLNVYSAEAVE